MPIPETRTDTWVAIQGDVLPVAEAMAWAPRPGDGAMACFCGTVRDHSEDRPGVVSLEYEAYEEHAERRMRQVAVAARRRVGGLGRIALLHRVGTLAVGEVSVVVVVSAPHRAEAFEAARFCIDSIKESVPIWKRETWAEGSDWALCQSSITDPRAPSSA